MNVLYQVGRCYLPQRLRFWIKRLLLPNKANQTVETLIPQSAVADALRVWCQDHLPAQALERFAHRDYRVPCASIIVLTHNNLSLTRLCIESLYYYTDYPNFELIIVDNASKDETRDYLEGLQIFCLIF
jgi:cellulose synthase/poly-beta-1,6-N-acetylglucosamine synthase-like glycosyltransferase